MSDGQKFDLGASAAYTAWRDEKLATQPTSVADLLVEIGDIDTLTRAEEHEIRRLVRAGGMAVYAGPPRPRTPAELRSFCARFGLHRVDANPLAVDGVTILRVHGGDQRARYIPYTDKPISWHTDGYYNPVERAVRGLLLHCNAPAAEGGANQLADPELVYIALRDENPDFIAALTQPDALTIPGNDDEGLTRAAVPGPVFYVSASGQLGMRYTARARNAIWSEAAAPASAALRSALEATDLAHRLEAGQGLISNNVLHTRRAFREDPAAPRQMCRIRFYDRVD